MDHCAASAGVLPKGNLLMVCVGKIACEVFRNLQARI